MTKKADGEKYFPALSVDPHGAAAEAWAYLSKSGKTMQVYVRPIDSDGNPILIQPVVVKVQAHILRRKT